MDSFSAPVRQWFGAAFPGPTRVQEAGWPVLSRGRNALLVAPTGSGKTLAAFLWAIDRLTCGEDPPAPGPGVRVVYVSPLKALAYDIERNLQAPLLGVVETARRMGVPVEKVGVDVRTGDTSAADRRRQLRSPSRILVTTPESLFLVLGSRAAANLNTVETVIVDEVHAMAATKRGAHLALSLERLAELSQRDKERGRDGPQRIGLSATVRPLDQAAAFLAGDRPVEVVDASEPPHLDLQVVVPVRDMEAPPPPEALLPPPATSPTARPAAASASPAGVGWPRGFETSGLWPSVFPRILEAVRRHRSTIVFVNSRSLCERLAQRLNDMDKHMAAGVAVAAGGDAGTTVEDPAADGEAVPAGGGPTPDRSEPLARAHHGSLSHEQRREVEGALKAGRLRCIVATSSLELGIDMGSVDLVLLVEAPGSTASGLQRVGRAGHAVGERSRGLIIPKFRGDLLECTVTAVQMLRGAIEPIRTPEQPLDVLAQQIVAMCCGREWAVDDVLALARRAHPYRGLGRKALASVLDMLIGRYPSEDFADLRPRLSLDRSRNLLTARRGAEFLVRVNAGTIPDRGLFSVHLGPEGPRVGELDEEMVYESRPGDTFLLGASSWRVTEITRDRVIVRPAPGEAGRMPFWHGDGPGRPLELGRALGAFVRDLGRREGDEARRWLERETPLDAHAISNLCAYVGEQRESTGVLPTDRAVTLERFRDEIGDWRVCILTPFGARIHAPWAMALERRIARRFGVEVQTLWTDDGLALRFADSDGLPPASEFLFAADEVEDLVVEQVASSSMFASRFRENASRALLLPRRRPGRRTPLWQQRQRSKNLLSVVRRYPDFPVLLETYRECLGDLFDLPGLVDLMAKINAGEVRVDDVETRAPSPFARSLVFAYEERFLYDLDAPAAERRAQALTLDRELLRELMGVTRLADLLDPAVMQAVEAELQGLDPKRRPRHADDLEDLLRRTGGLSTGEVEARAPEDGAAWLVDLARQLRAVPVSLPGGRQLWAAAEDAALYRDGVAAELPPGLPNDLLAPVPDALRNLVRRLAAGRGPFTADELAARLGLPRGAVESLLAVLETEGRLVRDQFRDGDGDAPGPADEWCDREVLRQIKRRSLARLRREAEPVDGAALARFLLDWQGVEAAAGVPPQPRRAPRGRGHGLAAIRGGADSAAVGRLREVLQQLEGAPLPWRTLVSDILPSRVPGFRVEMLDRMASAGELLWVGRGRLGARDGRVAIFRRERYGVLAGGGTAADSGDHGESGSDEWPANGPHGAIVAQLGARGACFTFDLVDRVVSAGDWREGEVEAALWDLVWAGRVTNDTFLPLASLGRGRRRAAERLRRPLPRGRRRGPLAGAATGPPPRGFPGLSARSDQATGTGGRLAGGRWSLVGGTGSPSAASGAAAGGSATAAGRRQPDGARDTRWAHAVAMQLLERHGVVAAETARAEQVPGGFEALYPVLREMEEAGHIRRGYFVLGLAGRQFALPAALERLRRAREASSGRIHVLPAVDPASPWGVVLPWPQLGGVDSVSGRRGPRRVAGAWLVVRAGFPRLWLEAGGRGVWTFAALGDDDAPEQALAALRDLAGRQRRRVLRLQRVDGRPARESPWAAALAACGFERDREGYRISRLMPTASLASRPTVAR